MAQEKSHSGKFSVVTGASSGIGLELAKCCARDGMEILIAADEPQIEQAAETLRGLGAASVEALEVDLSSEDGVDQLVDAIGGRQIEHLIANAGRGLGKGFLEQDWDEARFVVDTNITGTIYLLHELVPDMVAAGQGRVLLTGSIAGFMPGSYQAVYNGTKAFLDSFSFALREEIKDSGVTVTCLMPGATETEFFERADLMDTKMGTGKKMDPADVAKQGYDAMLDGKGEVITGWQNKMQAAMALLTPAGQLAKSHAKETAPGTAEQ